jgi:hypothetical protein
MEVMARTVVAEWEVLLLPTVFSFDLFKFIRQLSLVSLK